MITDEYREEARNALDAIMSDYQLLETDVLEVDILLLESEIRSRGISSEEIAELTNFYRAVNGMNGKWLNTPLTNPCEPYNLLFEFWGHEKSLWLGQRDMNTLRWNSGKFFLGDASSISYGTEYEFENMVGLLKKCFEDWNEIWKGH